MLRSVIKIWVMTTLGLVISAFPVRSDDVSRDRDDERYADVDHARIDRYLDVELWTNHSDGEYYQGDNIVLSYRTNRDAFVAIYSIDSRGRVNLLFPSEPGQDNFIKGGVTYRLPNSFDDFDLVVTGPEGAENIQIIASRERFPIPDWYPASGLVCDWDDRNDYMDYLNNRYFIRYDGQRFAYDRTATFVNEWEPDYFRPVYYPDYYPWSVYGNVYVDYPFGASVYIDGIYWGCAPLYIPYLYVGWHTFTVYDYYGYGWESPVQIGRYNTAVLGYEVIRTSPTVVSKYKKVRYSGYRDPVANGYPRYQEKRKAMMKTASIRSKSTVPGNDSKTKKTEISMAGKKKYVRGSAKLVKTGRGYETFGSTSRSERDIKTTRGGYRRSSLSNKAKGTTYTESRSIGGRAYKGIHGSQKPSVGIKRNESARKGDSQKSEAKISSRKSGGYYLKKSGSVYKRKSDTKRSTHKRTKSYDNHKSKRNKSSNIGKSADKRGRSRAATSSYRRSGGSKQSGKLSSSMRGRSSGKGGSSAGGGKSSRGTRSKGKK